VLFKHLISLVLVSNHRLAFVLVLKSLALVLDFWSFLSLTKIYWQTLSWLAVMKKPC